jgi:lysozyme
VRYLDGRPVRPTDPPITREHAYALAVEQLRREYLPAVLRLCPGIDSYERLAGVLSWTYNCGTGALQASTLRRRINAGDWPGAQTEMRKWCFAGGRVLRGLVIRRAVEAAMLA